MSAAERETGKPSPLSDVLATAVIDEIDSLGWTQATLADAVGMSEKHLSQMLTGRAEGSLHAWSRILGRLALTVRVSGE